MKTQDKTQESSFVPGQVHSKTVNLTKPGFPRSPESKRQRNFSFSPRWQVQRTFDTKFCVVLAVVGRRREEKFTLRDQNFNSNHFPGVNYKLIDLSFIQSRQEQA